ncbi:hypothetical protein Ancab_029914 [Ancistrocladus abbreviatus]
MVNGHSFIITVVEDSICKQGALKGSLAHSILSDEWSKTCNTVPATYNSGDVNPNDSNSGNFEACNDEPKLRISKRSRDIEKATTQSAPVVSKSFRDCGGISALNVGRKRKETTRKKETQGSLFNQGTALRRETEVLEKGKSDSEPQFIDIGLTASDGLDNVSKAMRGSLSLQSNNLNIVLKFLKKKSKNQSQSSYAVGPELKNKLKLLRGKASSSRIRKTLAKATSSSHSRFSLKAKSNPTVEQRGDSVSECSSMKSNQGLHSNLAHLQAKKIWEMGKKLGIVHEGDESKVIERIKELEKRDNLAWARSKHEDPNTRQRTSITSQI